MANRKLIVEIIGDNRSLSKGLRGSERDLARFDGRVSSGIGSLTRYAKAVAGVAIAYGGFKLATRGISAASDLNEQVNKSDVVFGRSADSIKAWSETTASSLGLSKRAALEAAGGYGQMLQTAGLTEKQSASFSKNLVKLAADMASFNNISPDEALLKLKSGLAGEAEPLRTVGVLLSEARVKQEAYTLGIAKQGAELTEAQKVQARYSLILKDTSKQQGDFARTSDSFANSQRRVKANLENISASVGKVFLPAIAKGTDLFADFLGELGKRRSVSAKIDFALDRGRDLARQGLELAADLRTAIGRELERIDWRNVGRNVGDSLVKGLDAIAGVIADVNWGKLGTSIVRGIADFLKGVDWGSVLRVTGTLIVKAVIALDTLVFNAARELGRQLLAGIAAGARAGAGLVADELRKLPSRFASVGTFLASKAGDIGRSIARGIANGLDDAKDFVIRKLLGFVNRILGVTSFLGKFDPFKGTREKVQARLQQMQADTLKSTQTIQGHLNSVKGKAVSIDVSENGVDAVQRRINGITGKTVEVKILTTDDADAATRASSSDARRETNAKSRATAAADRAKKEAAAEKAAAAAAATAREDAAKAAKAAARRAAKAKKEAIEAFGELMDALDLKQERAGATKSLQDDLSAARDRLKAVEDELKIEGQTVALQRQRFQIVQEIAGLEKSIAERQRDARQAKQFRALGLTAEGDKKGPSVDALKKRLGTLRQQIAGTFLDTAKTQGELDRIAKVLSGKFGKVGKDVREAILAMFADITGALSGGKGKTGPVTKHRITDPDRILEGVGLSPEEMQTLRSRLISRSAGGGFRTGRGRSALGFVIPEPVAVSGAGPQTVISGPITIYANDFDDVERELQKRSRRSGGSRRGRNGGIRR